MSADEHARLLNRRVILQGVASTPLLALLPGCSVSESGYSSGSGSNGVGSTMAGGVSGSGSSSGDSPGVGPSAGGSSSNSSSSSSSSSSSNSTSSSAFLHPGLLHTEPDFERMRAKVAAKASPWIDGWNVLIANSHASLSYTPRPQAVVSRGNDGVHPDNSRLLFNDVAAAYACALRWKVSGNSAYADKAVEIMNAWSSTLTEIAASCGCERDHDGILMAGLQGYQFANAGEIVRAYPGWGAADFAAFQGMMKKIFYPVNAGFMNLPHGSNLSSYSNWDLCCLASIMAIGVLCDDHTLFQSAVDYFQHGFGNGCIAQTVYYLHPGYLGQTQESGRDQGHDTLSVGLLAVICEQAWNQGVDLYAYDNNRVLAGAEYVAKGNLIESGTSYYSMPFATYSNGKATFTQFSSSAIGTGRPIWTSIYQHYVNRKGIAAPYSQRFATLTQPEGGGGNYGPNSGGYDQLGYGTLAFTRDPIGSGAAPSGLTAVTTGGEVVLSWWGTAYATSYNVKRGTAAGGPYTTVASGITDLLTYTDSTLAAGRYYYVVTAKTSSGETSMSNEASTVVGTALHTYLTMDDVNGTSAGDSSGNGHSVTLSGGVSSTSGKRGGALSLNGTDGYASLPAGILAQVGDFTIATWVYLNSSPKWARVFDFGTGLDQYMFLAGHPGNGGVCFVMSLNSGPGEEWIQGPDTLPTGKWVHVAVTLFGDVGTLYVDGAAVATNTAMRGAPFRLGNTGKNYIGRSQFPADPYANALIDEFRIYWGALSAAEVANLAAP